MSNEHLVRMYREELEYICTKFGRDYYIYCYDKTECGYRLPECTWILDVGVLLIHLVERHTDEFHYCHPTARPIEVYSHIFDEMQRETHTFEVHPLSKLSGISMHTGKL